MKLTADVIGRSAQFVNALKERELDLRGNKIPVIENLGATKDQFDTIDLSDNDIKKVDNFPLLLRLRTLFLNNNRVNRIGSNLEQALPNLTTLVLNNNLFTEVGDLVPLATVKSLRSLSLVDNQVTRTPNYRLFVIHTLPFLTLLDFRKIKQKEREEAKKLFSGKKGKELEQSMSKTSKSGPNEEELQQAKIQNQAVNEDVERIKEAIRNAKSLDEITYLENLLKTGGKLPPPGQLSFNPHQQKGQYNNGQEYENE